MTNYCDVCDKEFENYEFAKQHGEAVHNWNTAPTPWYVIIIIAIIVLSLTMTAVLWLFS